MVFKTKIVELIEQLMDLFENKNNFVYNKLIHLRHKVRNVLSDEDIDILCLNFFKENEQKIEACDFSIFKSYSINELVTVIWSELSHTNRDLIWKWIKSLSILGKNENVT